MERETEHVADVDPLDCAVELGAFFVAGAAAPEPRPCFNSKTGHAFVPGDADEWKHAVRAAAVEALLLRPSPVPLPTLGACRVRIIVWRARPKSHRLTGGQLKASAPRHATSRPDQDNTTKAILDALGAWKDLPPLFWADDAQVVDQHETKAWADAGERAGAAIRIELLP